MHTGWGVNIRDGVLVYGFVCSYTGWGVSIRFGVVEYVMGVLVNGMRCW